ncbi:MobB family relaxase [Formosa algae]|uniref:MobB family relaxase n=1 Tax=Formosa algae TaxID=225843 RepID=UPI000CCEBB6D|nr:MobB family relaxase [Formosa algae]PNW27292.1 mobilization protein [Formosa algae]
MYITITAQKIGESYSSSVSDFVAYLEKENEDKSLDETECFFNQQGDEFLAKDVIKDIDGNTSKLKKNEPRFYSITVNPSKSELKHIQNDTEKLKMYTKTIMEDYAKAFNREIEGSPIRIQDIKYYAKIEHERTYKGTDKAIKENAPYYKEIVKLRNDIQKIESGKLIGDIEKKHKQIKNLEHEAPHKINGKMITQGMAKVGEQSHIHIIVSRKDQSNRYSLSPGSKYKASEVKFNGKTVKRGFDRDQFFGQAEKRFDGQFKYDRNFVETYQSRKLLTKNPQRYYASLMGLPNNEKAIAFKLLSQAGVSVPILNVPTSQTQLVLKTINKMKQGVIRALNSGSISI